MERTASLVSEEVPTASLIGSVIAGRYKIREEIGEGGMGSVYLAEQARPIRRMVALKLIKPGMDSRAVLARFESERQALALMDHPNIARVLDAGSTEAGRPFFVMELVKGIPITEYCDRHRLGLPERLALVRQICSAVQHAHQKGIIHRDLKPSNILVESHDDKPVPKVIDFGLAKATSGLRLTEQSLFTAFGSVAGTPLYMAPEQASFNALDVDTRADIYSLGVILYELLTGSTPIRRETMQKAALDEILRVIREDEPPTPSSRLSTSDALPSPGCQSPHGAGSLEPVRAGRPGQDRDEGAGQGASAALRLGDRAGQRHRAVHQPRAGERRAAVGGVSAAEVRAAEPRRGDRGIHGSSGPGRRHHRDDAGNSRGEQAERAHGSRPAETGRGAAGPEGQGQRDPVVDLP